MQDLGYETPNSLFNLGTCAMFCFLYVFRVVTLAVIWTLSKIFPKLVETAAGL